MCTDENKSSLPVPIESIVDEKGDGEFKTGKDDHVEETGQAKATQNSNV